MKTYYNFENTNIDWKKFFERHIKIVDGRIQTICSWLTNKTLTEIYRLLFFMPYNDYEKDFCYYQRIKKEIEFIALQRKFDFFEEESFEVCDGRTVVWGNKT